MKRAPRSALRTQLRSTDSVDQLSTLAGIVLLLLAYVRPDSEKPPPAEPDRYRTLSNGEGGHLHLADAVED